LLNTWQGWLKSFHFQSPLFHLPSLAPYWPIR
jgi:hypothetical protein